MLSAILFSEYRKRILGLLLLNPESSFHVRELARITKTSAGTLHKELSKLNSAGILSSKKIGNQVHYSANLQCPIHQELASILRKTSGMLDVISDALISQHTALDFAFVFGSQASNEHHPNSDIDLMLIGQISFAKAVECLHPLQSTLQREINPVVYTPQKFHQRLMQQDPFLQQIMHEPKLFIAGNDHELREFIKDKTITSPPAKQAGDTTTS
jgi:predicted nucleotidyltransferase